MSLEGRTLFITGATRGIGLAIALRAARDGANIALLGKTVEALPNLPGTLDTAAEAVLQAGGQALPIQCDIRSEEQVERAVAQTVERFSGIDILINNASAIQLSATTETALKRFDLMHQVNVRGTFLCGQKCIPHLKRGKNPHILTLSPPLDLRPEYFGPHLGYSLAKFGMSLCTLGWAAELAPLGIAANSLWPRTIIDTAAVRNLLGGPEVAARRRRADIVADAAYALLCRPSTAYTGRFAIDEDVLREEGITDFDAYAVQPGADLLPDLFLPS